MREIAAIVESVHAPALIEVARAYSALREADAQLEKQERKTSAARDTQGRRRVEVGKALIEARKAWPRSGPRAKGWGEFLDGEGIHERSARDWMLLAGYVESENLDISAPGTEIPSRREVAADRRDERIDPDRERRDAARDLDNEASSVEVITRGRSLNLRLGRWEEALVDVVHVDAVIVDPPYGKRTHEAVTTRDDNSIPTGLTPTYDAWTGDDVAAFVEAWSSRCRGWMVALTSHDLIPAWEAAYRANDRYAFHPVPCLIRGMSVRIRGDGPSSWAVYAMVGRPRHLASWDTLDGGYEGPRENGAKSGRGKPSWLMEYLVRDYSRAGDLVCDPMAGFGSTLFAADRLGRRHIGAEMDETARKEAIRRWHDPKRDDVIVEGAA